ncbi:hypothetical protein BPAE_0112g00110 [Botrytis paeoniae]|uniref:Uncharacterized protein n=1 Tax=Botrytis paeoniae TaxID=278948 RepID=A0A4Z1FMP4_9HELO|nr:hypothetical protein BPAE_0112g00110 [Botrytis paeoniae]
MENEQSNRLQYNSETYTSTPSSNTFLRSLEAIQSLTNALEIENKESNRAQHFSDSFSATNSSSFLKATLGAAMSAADTLAKKIENEKNSRIIPYSTKMGSKTGISVFPER